ncbi:hypothetical protein F5Y16DRAFT_363524 [Xylariaceae sp. FL0255]|nr:hypothetical protein F5Y16DRAFT_363524 [Xylariaceae sp. FL0255]
MPPSIARPLAQPSWSRHGRHFLTSAARCQAQPSAKDAAARILDIFNKKESTRRQIIDGNQLQKLALTLGWPKIGGINVSNDPPPVGTPVPPGYHLVYFTPNGIETELGLDGTDVSFNAPAPFTRRMWAGGKMTWPSKDGDVILKVGDEAEERTRLISATAKKSQSVGEMVLVEVEKEISTKSGLALIDRRSWIFRPALDPKVHAAATKKLDLDVMRPTDIQDSKVNDTLVRTFCWSPTGLFRFSALTFNGHKIHYNSDWAANVEGHHGLVVHGPLNLINMLDYWRDVYGSGGCPHEIIYRAMSPLYSGETYQISGREEEFAVLPRRADRIWSVKVTKNDTVCMIGEIRGGWLAHWDSVSK